MTAHKTTQHNCIHRWANNDPEWCYSSSIRYHPGTHSLSRDGVHFARWIDLTVSATVSSDDRYVVDASAIVRRVLLVKKQHGRSTPWIGRDRYRHSRRSGFTATLIDAFPSYERYSVPEIHWDGSLSADASGSLLYFWVEDVLAELDPVPYITAAQEHFAKQREEVREWEIYESQCEVMGVYVRDAVNSALRFLGKPIGQESQEEWNRKNYHDIKGYLGYKSEPVINVGEDYIRMYKANFLADANALPIPFPLEQRLPLLHEFALKDDGKWVDKSAEREQRAKLEAERIKRKAEKEKLWPEREAAWRRGEQVPSIYDYDKPTMLRRSGDDIETSRGATVPFRRVQALFNKMMEEPNPYVALCKLADRDTQIGIYRFTHVAVPIVEQRPGEPKPTPNIMDAELTIGCHCIPWREVDRLFNSPTEADFALFEQRVLTAAQTLIDDYAETEICAVCGLPFGEHDGRELHRFSTGNSNT